MRRYILKPLVFIEDIADNSIYTYEVLDDKLIIIDNYAYSTIIDCVSKKEAMRKARAHNNKLAKSFLIRTL